MSRLVVGDQMIGKPALAVMLGALLFAFSSVAGAAEAGKCGANLVCASAPQTIVDGFLAAGYKAKLTKDSVGDPKIESAANGYDFSVYFYGCKQGRDCTSIQFQIGFADDGKNTLELANSWNRDKRFIKMAVTKDDGLSVSYDVSTLGGLTQENFADVIDWWAVMLGELNAYFKAQG